MMRVLNTLKMSSVLVGTLLAVSACMPRGETDTLDGVLRTAQTKFAAIAKNTDTTKIMGSVNILDQLVKEASGLNSGSAGFNSEKIKQLCSEIATQLDDVVGHAGYPSRPAFGEIASQFHDLGSADLGGMENGSAVAAKVKLIASRAYSLIAEELEGVGFKL